MRGWSFPSNQNDSKEEIDSSKKTFTSVSLTTKLIRINPSLSFFEEHLQLQSKLSSKSPHQDLNVSSTNISNQEMIMMWDLSNLSSSSGIAWASMSGIAWAGGADSMLNSESLIGMTSILRNGIGDGNEDGDSCNNVREEKLISGPTISSLAQHSLLYAEVRHPEAQDLELAPAGRIHQEVNEEDGRVHQEVDEEEGRVHKVNEEEKKKLTRHQIRGRAASALFWLLRKISRSDNPHL